jgi:hypothetical protein
MIEKSDSLTETFAVTVHPSHPQLPELTFVWMQRNSHDPNPELYSLSQAFDDDVGPPVLEMRDYRPGNISIIDTLLAWHLRAGRIGPFGSDDADYFKAASIIRETAEIPVKFSPLRGETLTSLLGVGSAGVLEIFHNGVTPAEAIVSVVFVAGAMILLGTANAVRRAIEAGLERKLLITFGVDQAKAIAEVREKTIVQNKMMSKARAERERSGSQSHDEPGKLTTAAYAERNPEIIAARQARQRARQIDIDPASYEPPDRPKV